MQQQAKLTLMDTSARSQEEYQSQHPFKNIPLEAAAPMMIGALGEFFKKPNKTKQDTLDLLQVLREVAVLLSPADKQSLNTGSGPNGFMNALDMPRLFPTNETKMLEWAQNLGVLLEKQAKAPLKGSGKRGRKHMDGSGFWDFLFGNRARVSPEGMQNARDIMAKQQAAEAARKAPGRAARAAEAAEKASHRAALREIAEAGQSRTSGTQERQRAIEAGLARRDIELTNPQPVSMTNAPVYSLESQIPHTQDMRLLNPNFYERMNGEIVFETKADEIAAEREAIARMMARPAREYVEAPPPSPPAPQITPLPEPNWRKWRDENRYRLQGIDKEGVHRLDAPIVVFKPF